MAGNLSELLITASPVGLAVMDCDFRFLLVNAAFQSAYGLPHDVIGRTLCELLPELGSKLEPLLRNMIITGVPLVNHDLTGELPRQNCNWLGSYFPLGNPGGELVGIGAMVAASPWSPQRRTEELRARYAALFETAIDAILIADDERRCLDANPSACSLFQFRRTELCGRRVDEFVYPPGAAFTEEDWKHFLNFGELEGELTFSLPSSTTRLVSYKARANVLPGNHVLVMRDVTERIAQEQALEQRTSELKEASRRKDEFLATLAHELRNPLTVINTARHLLAQPAMQSSAISRYASLVDRQVERLSRLVNDLLDVTRISRGRIVLQKTRADLAEIVERAVETTRPLVDSKRQLISFAWSRPLWIDVDPVRIEQVVVNLLNNAAKYTNAGGQIWISMGREGDAVALRVRDNGIGISAEMLPHVFDLFAQADRSLSRSEGGLGIGLALAQNLVEVHGGQLKAYSAGPDTGSEFVMHLPASGPSPSESLGHNARFPRAIKILVVNDNIDARDSLSALLTDWGHSVRVACDGIEALEAANIDPPEVTLLDAGLSPTLGCETASKLRQLPGMARSWVVSITGHRQHIDERYLQSAGIDLHLNKPLDVERLAALLREECNRLRDR